MLIVILYCGFYLFGLLIARWVTLPRQALVGGIAMCTVAIVGSLALWLMVRAGFVDAWLSIAMGGTIAVPALMMGMGLLAGSWMRYSDFGLVSILAAALPPVATVALLLFV